MPSQFLNLSAMTLGMVISTISIAGGPDDISPPVQAPILSTSAIGAAAYNWTGVYLGAVGGYVWGNSQHCDG